MDFWIIQTKWCLRMRVQKLWVTILLSIFKRECVKFIMVWKNTFGIVMSNESDKVETCKLSELNLVSEDVYKLISNAASKSCVLDCIPTHFLKDNSSVFVPIITCIINRSLSTGIFPNTLKHVVMNPLIKKQSLNPEELKNYRPVATTVQLQILSFYQNW